MPRLNSTRLCNKNERHTAMTSSSTKMQNNDTVVAVVWHTRNSSTWRQYTWKGLPTLLTMFVGFFVTCWQNFRPFNFTLTVNFAKERHVCCVPQRLPFHGVHDVWLCRMFVFNNFSRSFVFRPFNMCVRVNTCKGRKGAVLIVQLVGRSKIGQKITTIFTSFETSEWVDEWVSGWVSEWLSE